MNELSEAPAISKNEFNDSTSTDFNVKSIYPQLFRPFKLQLVKVFFQTCRILLQLPAATKAQQTKKLMMRLKI